MTNKAVKSLVCIFVAMICAICTFDMPVMADGETEDVALLYVTEYEVDNQTIIPGKEFTLKLTVENYSARATAKNVVVMIDNPKGVVPEYGTVSVKYIDSIGPKGSAELIFKYKADEDLKVTELDFGAYVSSDSGNTSTPLRLSVGREGDFTVDDFSVPEKIVVGKKEYISALIENVSDKDLDNVVMVFKCDNEVFASQNIGTMLTGVSKTQYVNVLFENGSQGQHSYELLLTYSDGAGTNKEYIISSGMLSVSDKTGQTEPGDNNSNVNNSTNGNDETNGSGVSNIVIICTIGILLIAVCCVALLLIYRRK